MPFSEDQKKMIVSFVESQIAAQKAAEANKNDANKKPADDTKTIAQQVQEQIAASNAKSALDQAKDAVKGDKEKEFSTAQLQESIKFNLSAEDFIKNNKMVLPEESEKILALINAKTFKDDNEKANVTRKNLLDSFLEKDENMKMLEASMRARADHYKSLAESDKEKRSSEFWDLVGVGAALKAAKLKAETLNKINGVNAGGDSKNILESKFIAAAANKFKHKTQ